MIEPWIGKSWGRAENGLGGMRLLVLGESHYCNPQHPDLVGKPAAEWTREIVEEYLSGEPYRFFTGITQVIPGRKKRQLSKAEITSIWASIAFCNYVPVFVGTGRV